MIGRTIEKYDIKSEIGRGGMGVVYRGYQKSLNRDVAIKVLSPQLASDKSSAERFVTEANLIAQLNHENIVQIYDILEKDGAYFIVMEYMEGYSLDKVIREKVIETDLEERIQIIKKVCAALDATHSKGIIHRDVKSANIFITFDKKVKLMDFGISKVTQSTMTTGAAIGTPTYMSPEQARGKPLDPGSDIYSLGVVLFECLTNRLPFDGEDAFAVALKHVHEQAPSPKKFNPTLSKKLERCTLIALKKNREERFRTCTDLALALDGKWPDYLPSEKGTTEKVSSALNELYRERVFFPGLSMISILLFIMIYQEYHIKEEKIKNNIETLNPSTSQLLVIDNGKEKSSLDTLITKKIVETKNESKDMQVGESSNRKLDVNEQRIVNKQVQSLTKLNQINKELEVINLLIDNGQFKRAQGNLMALKDKYPQNSRIQDLEFRLKEMREKANLREKLEDSLAKKNNQEALDHLRRLLVFDDKDIALKRLEINLQKEIDNQGEQEKVLRQLKWLLDDHDYVKLLSESKKFVDEFPKNQKGIEYLNIARIKIERIKRIAQADEIAKDTLYWLEKNQFSRAQSLLDQALNIAPKYDKLLALKERIQSKIEEEEIFKTLKKEERDIGRTIKEFAKAISDKDFKRLLRIIDQENKDFYQQETLNFQNLFNLTNELHSSCSILQFKLKDTIAEVSVSWKTKASFLGDGSFHLLFNQQVSMSFVQRGNTWKIVNYQFVA